MDKRKKNSVWIVVTVFVLLVLGLVAWKLSNTLPVYPAFRKEVRTVSELRKELDRNEDLKEIYIPDPEELGYEIKTIEITLDGRVRQSLPLDYDLILLPKESDGLTGFGISGGMLDTDPNRFVFNESYRGVSSQRKLSGRGESNTIQWVELYLKLEPYYYGIGAAFDTAAMTEEEIADQVETVTQTLYAVADRIID